MVSLPSERSTRFGNPAWPDVRTANFAAFGSWPGVLSKNAESLRDSDALMRVAVPRRRGPAGLRDLFRFCRNCGLYILCSGLSACMGQGWYHYPQCALCAVEIPDGRLSKRLICHFPRSSGRSSPHDSYFLADTQNFLLAVPVANAFALWYDKFSKLEFVLLVIIFGGLFFPVCHNIFNHCNTLIFSSSFIIFLHIAENMSAWF